MCNNVPNNAGNQALYSANTQNPRDMSNQASSSVAPITVASSTTNIITTERIIALLERENEYLRDRFICKSDRCLNKVSTVILPCGHVNLCSYHADQLDRCPQDNSVIKAFTDIYMS
jgi:hypothetical protein